MADILDAAQKQIDEAAKKLSSQKPDVSGPPPLTPSVPQPAGLPSTLLPVNQPGTPPSPKPPSQPSLPTTPIGGESKTPIAHLSGGEKKTSFAIGVKAPTVKIPISSSRGARPSRKSALLSVLLFLLLTVPLGVYYVSQEQQLTDLRSRAALAPYPCQLETTEYCVGNNPTGACYLGGQGNQYWCRRLLGNPGKRIIGSTSCSCPSPYTWGPRSEYGMSWCFNTAVTNCSPGVIPGGTDTSEQCALVPGQLLPGCPQPTSPPPPPPTPVPTTPPGVTPTRTPTPTQGPTPTRTPTPTLIPTAIPTPTPPVGGICEYIRIYDANGQDITAAVRNGTKKLAIGETITLATLKGNATKARFRIQGITTFEENDPSITTGTEYRRSIQIPSTITQAQASFETEVFVNGQWK